MLDVAASGASPTSERWGAAGHPIRDSRGRFPLGNGCHATRDNPRQRRRALRTFARRSPAKRLVRKSAKRAIDGQSEDRATPRAARAVPPWRGASSTRAERRPMPCLGACRKQVVGPATGHDSPRRCPSSARRPLIPPICTSPMMRSATSMALCD